MGMCPGGKYIKLLWASTGAVPSHYWHSDSIHTVFLQIVSEENKGLSLSLLIGLNNHQSQGRTKLKNCRLAIYVVSPYFINRHTVADYRPSTVGLQVKTLLLCILVLTPEIEVIYYCDYRKYSCNSPEICRLCTSISGVKYLFKVICYKFYIGR